MINRRLTPLVLLPINVSGVKGGGWFEYNPEVIEFRANKRKTRTCAHTHPHTHDSFILKQ